MITRTPLSRDFGSAMIASSYAKFLEDYATEISLLKFDPSTPKNIYDEATTKAYLPAVPLAAKARLNPGAKYLADIGITEKVDAIFIVARKQLTDLGQTITSSDKIKYQGAEFAVLKVSPMGQLKDLVFFDMVTAVLRPENA